MFTDVNWPVMLEAVQTLLRKNGVMDAYETCKEFVQNKFDFKGRDLAKFIDNLSGLGTAEKELLKKLSPHTYTGIPS